MGTMVLLDVVLQGSVEWAICANDPTCFELRSLPGCSVINPALYPRMVEFGGLERGLTAKATFINHGDFYFVSNTFFLAVDENSQTIEWTPDDCLEWERRLSALVNHLRFASKQASLKARLAGFGPCSLPIPPLQLPQEGERCATASWHIRTAVRGEHILHAGEQSLDVPPPSHATLLLDAIDSLMHGEYATAFLLGAISMDHLSRVKATEALAAAFQACSGRSLAVDFSADTTPESQKERTEELFNLLLRDRRFKQLLHSVPLALTGRSLLRDNKDLYDRAIQVYEIRNRVVHKDLVFKDEFLPRFFGCDEAIEAIRCAIQLADWFGVGDNYAHPFDGVQGIVCLRAKPGNP